MAAFLKQVAEHYYAQGEMEHMCFIFPNRRASAFFRKYVSECVARSRKPLMSPRMLTINDFFYQTAGASQTDQVHLLLELYDCYAALNPAHETLDEFIFWGNVLLSDFNDVDKYLVKADALFTNVSEFREMQDGLDYLDDVQLDAIRRFVSHFKSGGRYKDEFRRIWDILLPLYRSFNERLEAKGMSYEGKVYRALAERLSQESVTDVLSEHFPGVRQYVFVGLNALNECERHLMRKMRNAGIAEFCWDYSSDIIKDADNKSSFFLKDNVAEFPQAFRIDAEGLPGPEFNVLSVPSSIGQAKQLPELLKRLGAVGMETAVVLADETQLIPVLNSIPEYISDINVTMGYPLRGGGLWSLMNEVSALQMHLRFKDGQWLFYHKQVWNIFSNSLVKSVLGDRGRELVKKVRKEARYYVSAEELAGDTALAAIFRPVVTDSAAADQEQISRIQDYQCGLLSTIASLLKDNPDMAMELDFAKEYYLAIGRLRTCSLPVLPATYFRLLDSLIHAASVPFKGEPLKGLQIMGPLETRALDFDNVIILNCNEGMFPRRNVASSFIPAELRRGFQLPTYEYQDAVWAYYFYRMIQRASKVWMVYDSRTEGTRNGEESRYIKQLEMHFGKELHRYVAKAPIEKLAEPDAVEKTPEDIEWLKNHKKLSASSFKNYLSCPLKFYYASIKGLKSSDEVLEFMDGASMGTVFHETMERIYTTDSKKVTRSHLSSVLEGDAIRNLVHERILAKMNSFEVSGRDLVHEEIICRYVRMAILRDIEWMDANSVDAIDVVGLELEHHVNIGGFSFKGVIDRLDFISDDEVRVVDYKTGHVTDNDFIIDESNAQKVVDALFGPKESARPNIALQLYIYDKLVASMPEMKGKSIVNSIYQPARLFVHEVENVRLNEHFVSLMDERMKLALEELCDLEKPFRKAEDADACKYCDFKTLCGR